MTAVAWVDTASETFFARHDERDARTPRACSAQLEYARERLEERFDARAGRARGRAALLAARSSTPRSRGCRSRAG